MPNIWVSSVLLLQNTQTTWQETLGAVWPKGGYNSALVKPHFTVSSLESFQFKRERDKIERVKLRNEWSGAWFMLDIRKKNLYWEGVAALEQVIQRGQRLFVLGGFQDSARQSNSWYNLMLATVLLCMWDKLRGIQKSLPASTLMTVLI